MVWERYNEVNSNHPADEKDSYTSESNCINSDPGLKSPEFEAHVPEEDFDGSSLDDDTLTVEEFVLVEDISLVKLEDPEILASLKSSDLNLCDHRKLIGSLEVETKQGRGRRRKNIPKKTKVNDELGSCYVWQITKWLLSEDKEHLDILKLQESCETEENCDENDVNPFENASLVKHYDSSCTDACDEDDIDGFTCHYCSKKFYVKKVLERHIIIAHLLSAKNNYPCVECDAVMFNCKSELVRHMKDFHYICGICYESYDPEEGMEKHLESHTSEMIYSCNKCQKGFSHQKALEQHLLTHRNMYPCTLCPKKFYIKGLFNSHMRSHSGPFHCNKCMNIFPSYSVLQIHLKTHESENTFTCNHCASTFIQKEDFVKHQNDHALKGEASSFFCSKCDVHFTSKSDFVTHLKLCTITDLCVRNDNKLSSVINTDFVCKVKPKKIVTKSPVSAKKKGFECPECSITFPLKRRLMLHLKLHEIRARKLQK